MEKAADINGKDVDINDLIPLNTREINLEKNIRFKRILSSIKAIGLIEPLSIYKENGKYAILDGFLRYKACQMLKKDTIPCILSVKKEGYTYNRMVNRLSPLQETRMVKKSLEIVSDKMIATVFGIKSFKYHIPKGLIEQLHPEVLKSFDNGLISRKAAEEFTYVMPGKQLQILKELEENNHYGYTTVRSLVLKTPKEDRNPEKKPNIKHYGSKKYILVERLANAEKEHDFFANLYKNFSIDLIKLFVYVRKLIVNKGINSYLSEKRSETLKLFMEIVSEKE